MNQESEDEILSNSLSLDIERKEMSWNENIENLLKKWADSCVEISEQHTVLSKIKKRVYYSIQFPIIIIPFVLSFVNTFENEYQNNVKYVISLGNLLLGILSGTNILLNYSSEHVKHQNASNRYDEIALEIETILTKRKRYREASDIVIERYKQKIESLNKFSINL